MSRTNQNWDESARDSDVPVLKISTRTKKQVPVLTKVKK